MRPPRVRGKQRKCAIERKEFAMKNCFVTARVYPGDMNALVKNLMRQMKIDNPNEAVRRVNSGEWIVSESVQTASPEPVLDFIMRVDRSVKPSYPDWIKGLMNPELELA